MKIFNGLVIVALALPCSSNAADIDVLFTGRLLGHARFPANQTLDGNACSATDGSLYASAFMAELGNTKSTKLLVGLGDNFAPEYAGRVIQQSGSDKSFLKELLVWDTTQATPYWLDIANKDYESAARNYDAKVAAKGAGIIPFDNVACFFVQAGYRP